MSEEISQNYREGSIPAEEMREKVEKVIDEGWGILETISENPSEKRLVARMIMHVLMSDSMECFAIAEEVVTELEKKGFIDSTDVGSKTFSMRHSDSYQYQHRILSACGFAVTLMIYDEGDKVNTLEDLQQNPVLANLIRTMNVFTKAISRLEAKVAAGEKNAIRVLCKQEEKFLNNRILRQITLAREKNTPLTGFVLGDDQYDEAGNDFIIVRAQHHATTQMIERSIGLMELEEVREKKFLGEVPAEELQAMSSSHIHQGYLMDRDNCEIMIRKTDYEREGESPRYHMVFKSFVDGKVLKSAYMIPESLYETALDHLVSGLIEKYRYTLLYENCEITVDQFLNEQLNGLTLTEVKEEEGMDEDADLPDWLGKEVPIGSKKYNELKNNVLARRVK